MEGWQKHQINLNLPELIESTECNYKFLAILQRDEILSEEEAQYIVSNAQSFWSNIIIVI